MYNRGIKTLRKRVLWRENFEVKRIEFIEIRNVQG